MALLSPFLRAMGMSDSQEIEDARRARAATEASSDPADVFSAAVADRVKDMGQGGASRVLHEIGHGQWPSDPDLRWKTASTAARAVADRAIATPVQNLDGALGMATTRHALGEAASGISASTQPLNANVLLGSEIQKTRHQVLALMSYGKAAEYNARDQADALLARPDQAVEARLREDVRELVPDGPDRGMWLLEAGRTRLAMAQSGLLDPDRTIRAAMDASTVGVPIEGALAPYDRARANTADPVRRSGILSQMQQRTMIAAYGKDGPPAEISSAPIEQKQLTPIEQKAHAALLMQEQLAKSRPVDHPSAIMTGGQPGSGKSYVVRSVGVQFEGHGGVIKIDPDAIRPTLPYMKERIDRGDLDIPDAAYNDAGTIAYQMIQIAKIERRNVIIDGTLQNTKRATELAEELREAKYGVHFHGVAVHPDLSHARTYSRREDEIKDSASGFGRGVGDEFHDQAVKGYGLTVESFQKKASVNSMTLHFGDEGKPVSTRLVDGHWVPAVSMKDELDNAHVNPSPARLKEAEMTWIKAESAMKGRQAPQDEIAKVETFRTASSERAASSEKGVDPLKAARIQAMRSMNDRGMG